MKERYSQEQRQTDGRTDRRTHYQPEVTIGRELPGQPTRWSGLHLVHSNLGVLCLELLQQNPLQQMMLLHSKSSHKDSAEKALGVR
ncbi:hypothetical protein AMECASPLE_032694 [Ameca splendens]|uniref:Uncharacterized protein n=1 Tax=Ameca splendens TaxID=208324 RepID=A0ABV0ZRI5_9TELE